MHYSIWPANNNTLQHISWRKVYCSSTKLYSKFDMQLPKCPKQENTSEKLNRQAPPVPQNEGTADDSIAEKSSIYMDDFMWPMHWVQGLQMHMCRGPWAPKKRIFCVHD